MYSSPLLTVLLVLCVLQTITRFTSAQGLREPTEEELDVHHSLVQAEHELLVKKASRDVLAGAIFAFTDWQRGITGVLEHQTVNLKARFDKAKFSKLHPDLYRKYINLEPGELKTSFRLLGKEKLESIA